MRTLAILVLLLAPGLQTMAAPPRTVPSEVYRAPTGNHPPPTLKSGIIARAPSLRLLLSAPSAAELATLALDASPPVVGLGRPVPAAQRFIQGTRLSWHALADGGQVAAFSVRSPGARALRLQLNAENLAAGATFHFHAPGAPTRETNPVSAAELLDAGAYWSPPVSGDTVAVAIRLPSGAAHADLAITLHRVSHLVANPARAGDLSKRLAEIGAAAACQVDVRCRNIPDSVLDSVAKLLLTDPRGFSALCTGTLLADADPDTQIPYLLTNHHCGVADPRVAASLQFYWFFQRTACGGGAPDRVVRTGGGATVLSAAPLDVGNDHALLRLNRPPPDGVSLSGWSADPVPVGSPVVSVHHPRGDLKKLSTGTVVGYESISLVPGDPGAYWPTSDGVGPYLAVHWQEGTSERGSSGAGLWRHTGAPGGPLLVGSQLGGASSCQRRQVSDQFGRFDLTYRAARYWLAGSADYSALWLDPERPGQGVQLLQSGTLIQGAWYTYDADGRPLWLTFVAARTGRIVGAPLLRFSGPPLGSPWNTPNAVEVGRVTLDFFSPTQVGLAYTLEGVSDSLVLVPFTSRSAGGYTGVWWDPATPGQSVQLVQGGNQLAGAWYLYDSDGQPLWLTFTGTLDPDNGLLTRLLRFTGPALGQPWNTEWIRSSNGGAVRLRPTGAARLQLDYRIGEVQGRLNLVPFAP